MTQPTLVLVLEAAASESIRLLSEHINKLEDIQTGKSIVVTVTRSGHFSDPRYGDFELSEDMFKTMIGNFDADVYGQRIALDVAHEPEKGAAAYIDRLFLDGNKLRAKVTLTPYGVDAIKNKGYIYLSAEIHQNYTDNESGKNYGPVLLGAGLVVRPCIKRLDPVIELSESSLGDKPTYLSDRLATQFKNEVSTMWKELLELLQSKLKSLKLSEDVIQKFSKSAEESLKTVTDKSVGEQMVTLLVEAAEKVANDAEPKLNDIKIQLSGNGLDEAGVKRLFEKMQSEAQQAASAKKDKLDKNIKLFNEKIDGAEGLTDDIKTQLKEGSQDLITGDLSESQVTRLAETQLKFGEQMAVKIQLDDRGFSAGPSGVVQLSQSAHTEAEKLQGIMHEKLKLSSSFANGALKLKSETHPFVEQTLKLFDSIHGQRINKEVLALDGGSAMADTDLPVGFQREVIREALSDLNILNLVQSYTDATATTTTNIPYELRDSSKIVNQGIVYEGKGIPKSKVQQKMDLGYILPMKIAIEVTNEVMHFTRASAINWDAWGRNVATAARILREMVAQRIANEMQRMADSYMAGTVADESIAAQLDGNNNIIKTANFPIVRPHQQFDLAGNSIGNPENEISVSFAAAIQPFDGTGQQAAGTYWYIANANLGYIGFVDEAGNPVTPSEAAATISYSYATNIAKVDADIPAGTTKEKHLNTLLQKIGARKAYLSGQHFSMPDFLLMSPTLNDECTNAEMFAADSRRNGSNTDGAGDLATVKGLSAFGTNAPGIDLGDERIVMGQRGQLSYCIAKPWSMSEMIEGRDSNGTLNGTKEAYGEEYNCIKMPKPLQNRFTSLLFYSFTNR